MDPIRIVLLLGLVAHKAVWLLLKRSRPASGPARPVPLSLRAVKLGKMTVLAFLVVQTAALDVLPILDRPGWLRAVGLCLFGAGLGVAVAARWQLGRNWADIEDHDVSHSRVVVARGLYRSIRHPIYAGDVLLVAGLELALNSWLVLGALLLVPVVVRHAIAEERALRLALPGYEEYCRQTKRFVPHVI